VETKHKAMIQANELRLGNLVYRRSVAYRLVVLEIKKDSIVTRFIDDSDSLCNERPISEFTPIGLTEKLLLKAGFEESVDESNESIYSKWYSINDKSTTIFSIKVTNEDIMPDDVEIKDFDIYDGDRYIKSVKSLHQLQNLYFALTGKELEFKL